MEAKKWECEFLSDSRGIFLMHYGRSQAAEPVFHDFVMLAYAAHGEGQHHIDNKSIDIREGDILIVNPDTVHYFTPSDRYRYIEFYYCFITKTAAESIYSLLRGDFPELVNILDMKNNEYIHVSDNANRELRGYFVRMIDEFMNCPPGHGALVTSYLTVTLAKIFRLYLRSMNNPVFGKNKIVDEAIRFINYNINYGVTLKETADALHLSEEYLCRLFKKHTGTTVKQYIIGLKIEKAKDLLRNTDRSIESISVSLNCNQVYIGRLFKKHTGMTMLNFRKKYHYRT